MAQDERHRRRAAFTTVSMAALAACSPVASADTSRIWDVDASAGVNIARHWPMLLILGFLAVAILIEIVRRLRQRAAHLRQQWRAVRKLAEERELSRKEQELLESLVRRYAARAPFEAVSGYRDFDACVARDIEEQARSLDARAIEARGAALRELRVRLGLDYVPFGLQIRSTRELCVGQVLWAAREANAPQWHKMRVASVDEARFRADVAAEDTRPPFEAGETLRFRIWRDEDARYTFATRLVRIEERPAQWVLDHTHDLDRVQARAHYRIRFDETAAVSILGGREEDDYSGLDQRPVIAAVRGRITSLSGGGLAVILEEAPALNAVIRAPLELAATAPLEVYARVVNVAPLGRGRYLVRGAFVAIPDETREAVTRYVFHQQQLRAAQEGDKGTAQ